MGEYRVRKSKHQKGKAYIVQLGTSTLPRSANMNGDNGVPANLKRFMTRRGRPKKIYSDNGGTFVAAAK